MIEERLAVVCDGLRLAGGAYLPPDPKGAIVLLHGLPSATPADSDDEGYPGFAREFAARGWVAAWADMRSVRESPGYFSIGGWVRDARAIVDAARSLEGVAGLPLALSGSSAGGAVATEVVARGAPVDALITLAAPASWVSFTGAPAAGVAYVVQQTGMQVSPEVVADPSDWAAEFESVTAERSATKVRVPMLIMHGSEDDTVPVDHAERIADKAGRGELKIIEGAGHQLRRVPSAIDAMQSWLEQVLR